MKKAVWSVLILALLGIASWYFFKKRAATDSVTWNAVKASRGELFLGIQATGAVDPQNRVVIRPPLSGRLEDVLVQEGDWVKRGQVLALLSSSERTALLDAARMRSPEELKRWQDLYRPTPMLAPITGTIIARNTQPGQTVGTGDVVLVVSDRLVVRAQVDETDIARIRLGQPGRITLDAYPKDKIPAKVDHIAYEAKTVNNVTMYEVQVLPKEIPSTMRSGMTANVEFEAETRHNVLLVPSEAIKMDRGRSIVLVPAPGSGKPGETPSKNNAQPLSKTVETGATDGLKTEILSGLEEGDTVLIAAVALPKWEQSKSPLNFSPPKRPRGAR